MIDATMLYEDVNGKKLHLRARCMKGGRIDLLTFSVSGIDCLSIQSFCLDEDEDVWALRTCDHMTAREGNVLEATVDFSCLAVVRHISTKYHENIGLFFERKPALPVIILPGDMPSTIGIIGVYSLSSLREIEMPWECYTINSV